MQLYLCEKYDKDHKISFPYDSDEYWETVEWLVWMVGSVWRRYPLFVPNKTFELPQMVPPTNPILLKHSKAASDLCRGNRITSLDVSIAVIDWFEIILVLDRRIDFSIRRRPREDPLRHQPLPDRDQAPVPSVERPSRVGAQDQQDPRG
jgi:hypothetical protein